MKKYCFGVDVGGTTIKMGLFDVQGNVIDKWEIETRTENHGENVLPDIAKAVQDKLAEKNITKEETAGVGVGVPGPVDGKGVVHRCVNLGWDVFNVNEKLGALLGLPVMAGNDANVAALGEMWKGGGQGYHSIVVVTLGTGVGGGIILDGKMLTGATGAGGEIGHIHVQDGEPDACGCGNHGCLEQYASATGIVRLAKRALAKTTEQTVLNADSVTAKDVWDAVKAGDSVAISVAEQFGKYLGEGLAAIACVVNPEAFVIGGGVSKAGDVLLSYIEKNYKPVVFHGSRDVKFTLATLGNDAGIYGAAKLVLD
jgi:glucokinase